nr:retrovirus-related Pol polyprotein from transposon TNT 1-94 [Tanacetum cinerariifolium]
MVVFGYGGSGVKGAGVLAGNWLGKMYIDARVQNFKALELEIERLLKAVVSLDIMTIMQKESVVDTSDLQTELEFTSNSVSTPQESKVVNNDKVITPGMFRINPDKTSREEKKVPNFVRANVKTKLITVSQPPVITKKDVNSDVNGLSSIGVDNTKTRRPQPKSNTKNDRVPSTVYFLERLGHNLLFVGQFCDSDLEVAFRRNACFVRNLEGVDLLKGDRSTNLYTINIHEIASASPICLMARASSTKSWLWHQRLSHLNFDAINDLARNDFVSGLPKFKYHKEHLCPS